MYIEIGYVLLKYYIKQTRYASLHNFLTPIPPIIVYYLLNNVIFVAYRKQWVAALSLQINRCYLTIRGTGLVSPGSKRAGVGIGSLDPSLVLGDDINSYPSVTSPTTPSSRKFSFKPPRTHRRTTSRT